MIEGIKSLKLEGQADDRSLVHIVRFVDGYSVGWSFCLREELREMLDIRAADRVGFSSSETVYFQGKQYCFAAGHLIYDCREAYERKWEDALKVIRYAVQVVSAIPAGYVKTKEYRTTEAVGFSEDGKLASEPAIVEFTRRKMGYGEVELSLLKNNSGLGLREIGRFKTDQEKFISFLQSGILRDFSGAVLSSECAKR
jgi:hypothetical protein